MTDPITRARDLLAKATPTHPDDIEALRKVRAAGNMLPWNQEEVQLRLFSRNVIGPLLDVLEQALPHTKIYRCQICGNAGSHSPGCAAGPALAAIEKALEEVK